jgi:hypothetical protein
MIMHQRNNRIEISYAFLLTIILILSVLPSGHSGKDGNIIYVDDDNVDGPWDGSPAYPFRYIVEGIEHASSGDTVFVRNGFYHENIDIDKIISLIGEDKLGTVIDGLSTNDVVAIYTNGVNISNFTIRNSGDIANAAGIKITTNGNQIINNNIVDNNLGLRIIDASDNIIYGNNFALNMINALVINGENIWNNNTHGNWWDDFDEPSEGAWDNNSDGIIDSPYQIEENDEDLYPLSESNGDWEINQPPLVPWNPDPKHGEQNTSIYTALKWNGGDPNYEDTVTYDVYFGTENTPPKVESNQTGTSYDPPEIFDHETTYYWRIVAWDNHNAQSENQTWSFMTHENHPPNNLSNPKPSNGKTDVSLNTDLEWEGGDPDQDTVSYDIYFGSNSTPPKIKANVSGEFHALDQLEYEKKYYWRVIARDIFGVTTNGSLWNFTTSPPANRKPIADAGGPYFGYVNSPVYFYGSGSNDTDGNITKWFWDFGDDTNATGETVSHAYTRVGIYNLTLTVTDDRNATGENKTIVTITQPNRPPSKPTIQGPSTGKKSVSYGYEFMSTDEDGDLLTYSVDWDDGTSDESDRLTSGTTYELDHSWSLAGKYTLEVRVSDNETSSVNEITVLIDAINVGTLGYLTDDDGDEIYDAFYLNVMENKRNVSRQDNGTYLIDVDGDGKWDHLFDPVSGELSEYEEKQEEGDFPWLYLGIGLFIIFIIGLFYRRRRNLRRQWEAEEQMQQAQREQTEPEQPYYPM